MVVTMNKGAKMNKEMNKIPKGFKDSDELFFSIKEGDIGVGDLFLPKSIYDKRISILMDWAKHGKHIGSGDIQSLMINGDYDEKRN
jgi:hypothetical protein